MKEKLNYAAIDAAVRRLQSDMKHSFVPRKVTTRHVHQPFRRQNRVYQVAGGFSTPQESAKHTNTTDITKMWNETWHPIKGVVKV